MGYHSVAGYIFTKVCRTMIKKWRSLGHKIVMFLDDGLGGNDTYDGAVHLSAFVRTDLLKFGFLLADAKCMWVPSQTIVWLGYVWNALNGTVAVTNERILRFETLLSDIVEQVLKGHVYIFVRKLACLVGQLTSMQCVLGSVTRLYSRAMYECVNQRASWQARVKISDLALSEMLFWKEHVRNFNVSDMSTDGDMVPEFVVFSDASDVGFGGYIEGELDTDVCGSWSVDERALSSTWRELEAVHRVLQNSITSLEGHSVTWKTDNKNVASILNIGSRKPYLQEVAVMVDTVCRTSNIVLNPVWIPRADNIEADYLSRCCDSDDWIVQDWVFNVLDRLWGPHTFDRFAYDYNTKCVNFNSKFWCKNTGGVDAFAQIWSGELNWLVPPPRLVNRCVTKALKDKCECTLFFPEWKSAPYWPVLFPDGVKTASFVVDKFVFQPGVLTRRGRGKNGIFDGRPVPFRMVALKMCT